MILDKKVGYNKPDYTVLPFYEKLSLNGWKRVYEDGNSGFDDGTTGYKLTVCGEYEAECIITVSEEPESLEAHGSFGIMWIQISKYDADMPYDMTDLEDMANIIDSLEDSLLGCDIPFLSDNPFVGRNKREKAKRNNELRQKLKIGEIEKRTREQLENGEIKRYW